MRDISLAKAGAVSALITVAGFAVDPNPNPRSPRGRAMSGPSEQPTRKACRA
jgi:hypothetical protein